MKELLAHVKTDSSGKWVPLENVEKFGYEIVKEAIKTVQSRFMGDLNREDLEVRRCVEALKRRFGVEE